MQADLLQRVTAKVNEIKGTVDAGAFAAMFEASRNELTAELLLAEADEMETWMSSKQLDGKTSDRTPRRQRSRSCKRPKPTAVAASEDKADPPPASPAAADEALDQDDEGRAEKNKSGRGKRRRKKQVPLTDQEIDQSLLPAQEGTAERAEAVKSAEAELVQTQKSKRKKKGDKAEGTTERAEPAESAEAELVQTQKTKRKKKGDKAEETAERSEPAESAEAEPVQRAKNPQGTHPLMDLLRWNAFVGPSRRSNANGSQG